MATNDDLIMSIADAVEAVGKRLSKVESSLGSASGEAIARERRSSERERRLLSEERASSQAASANAAREIMGAKESIEEMVKTALEEVARKEASAKTGQTLMQAMRAELQEELLTARQEINEMVMEKTRLAGEITQLSQRLDVYAQDLKTNSADLKKSAYSAAASAVKDLSDQKMSQEIERQLRVMSRQDQNAE